MDTGSVERGTDTVRTSDVPIPLHCFPKSVRLRTRRDYLAVQQTGRRFQGRHFLAMVVRLKELTTVKSGRAGITVTKKVGNAVTRNRIKRMVKEHLRQSSWLQMPVEAVIIAKHSAARLGHQSEFAADLSRIQARIQTALASSRERSAC